MHPVEIFYMPTAERGYIGAAVRTVVQIHIYEALGDVRVNIQNTAPTKTA